MPSADKSKQFFAMAVKLSLLSQEQASSLEEEVLSHDRTPQEVVSEKGLLSPVQLDILQTMLAPESVIPGYGILDVIGLGGMGVIYRAKQIALDREVALKTILMSQIGIPNVIRRFQQEAQAVARLQHPHIVTAYDFGQAEGRFYFAMELVNGVNADQYLKREGQVEETVALSIVLQAISGLAQAHEQQIIHRDLKPANLLLTNAPKGYPLPPNVPLVKIADFGLAFLAEQGEDRTRLTSQNSAIGSPNYLAPEQLETDGVDHRVDIYGLGATLYHLLAGEAPFKAKSLNQILSLKLAGKVKPLSELNEDVSLETIELVSQMMAADPNERISDYSQLWERCSTLVRKRAGESEFAKTILSGKALKSSAARVTEANSMEDTVLLDAPTVKASGARSNKNSVRALKWTAIILCVLLGGWGGYAWVQSSMMPPRPQLLTGPGVNLFNGDNLAGWKTLQGYVHPGKGEEGERLLVVEDQGMAEAEICNGMLPLLDSIDECPASYAIELSVDLSQADIVLIGFAQAADGSLWSIRLTEAEAALVQSPPGEVPTGNETVFTSAAVSQKGPMQPLHISLVRDRDYWFLSVNDYSIARVPLNETVNDAEKRVVLSATGGPGRFGDLTVFLLNEPAAPVKMID
ncbi:MAG: serine/threonine-protein kinase [Planctomycetaceae bacterium]